MKKFSLTTKGSYRHNSANKRLRTLLAVFLCLVLVFYITPSVGRAIGQVVFFPVILVGEWWNESESLVPNYFRTHTSLTKEIKSLENKLLESKLDALTIGRLQFENGSLRELLSEEGEERYLAGVVARPNEVPYDNLVIDKGREEGISENTPVYIGNDVVIGYVSRTFKHSSVVTLVSTPGLESTVFIVGPNIYTTAVGEGGGVFKIGIPQDIVISVGDMVIMPTAHSGIYGKIESIEQNPSEPEQYAYLSLPINLNSINFVSVGKVPKEVVQFDVVEEVVKEVREDLFRADVPAGVLVEIPNATSTPNNDEEL